MRNLGFFAYGVLVAALAVSVCDALTSGGRTGAGHASDLASRPNVVTNVGREDLIRSAYTWSAK